MNILMINADYSIVAEVITTDAVSIVDVLSGIDTFTNIVVNIIVIIGGILGFNYIRKIKEKQIDATFSYLTRLNVRLKFFNDIFITYGEEIMDCFIPENYRREIVPDRISLVSERIKDLAENAKETLKFIRDENNQMPAQKGWVDKFNTFVEFLIDCEQLDQSIYYKWSIMDEYEEKKSQYYEENSKNIQELLRMVHERQIKLEEEMFKKN